jgi:hypothetical protein
VLVSGVALSLSACGSSTAQPKPDAGDAGDAGGDEADAAAGDDADAGSANACGDAGAPSTPTSVYSGTQVPSMAVGSTAVYWSEECPPPCSTGGGTLWTQPIAGGTPTQLQFPMTIGGGLSTPTSLTIDGPTLWFLDADGLQSIGLDGSNPKALASSSALGIVTPAWGLAVDADNVYVIGDTVSFATQIVSVPKVGGTVKTLATVSHSSGPANG